MYFCLFLVAVQALFQNVFSVDSKNACDPIKENITIKSLFFDDTITFSLHYNLLDWMNKPLNYVNCSKRGLTSIPEISQKVEVLDLSFNVILHLEKKDLKRFSRLVVLWLPYNCPRNIRSNLPFCKQRVRIGESAFENMFHLKMLNLAHSILEKFPKNLPLFLQYIDVSQTAISPISENEIGYLKNLTVFVANDVCIGEMTDACKTPFSIFPDAFKASTKIIKVLSLRENNLFKKNVSTVIYPNLLFLDLSQTRIRYNQFSFQSLFNLRHLQLQQMHPDSPTPLRIYDHMFDNLPNLVYLDLSNNQISYLPDDIFKFNLQLGFLDLSENCLNSAVQKGTFLRNATNLKYLYLGFNYCYSHVSNAIFEKNQNDTIQVNRKNIYLNLEQAYGAIRNLEKLSFGTPSNGVISVSSLGKRNQFNTITNQSVEILKNLSKLRDLSLAHCQIRSLNMETFYGLSLSNLDLSNNHLEELAPVTSDRNNAKLQQIVREVGKVHFDSGAVSAASPVSRYYQKQNEIADEDFCNGNHKLDLSLNYMRNTHQKMFLEKFSIQNFTEGLDLSSNILLSIRQRSFKHWLKICYVDLRNNPINYIHNFAFSNLPRLQHVLLNNTQVFQRAGLKALYFLLNIQTDITLKWWKGQFFDNFKPHKTFRYHYAHVKSVDLSYNLIKSKESLERAFLVFPKTQSISLRFCYIFFSDFSLKNPLVTFFDASENNIPSIPMETLKNMPRLRVILLYKNQISSLKNNLFSLTPDLEKLDLSYNRINFISADFFKNSSKKFDILLLRNNYLTQHTLELFPLPMLQNLKVFDIRWNSFVCSCSLTKSFGQWLINFSFALNDRPGLLPKCLPLLDFFGGCVSCQNQNSVFKRKSLLSYCSNKSCQAYQSIWLCLLFTGFTFLFLFIGIVMTSSNVKAWLARQALKEVVSFSNKTSGILKSKKRKSVFLFHACIFYDLYDSEVANWVESKLVSNLEKFCKITVRGRDDQCGMSPVKQMLLKIERSRKVIIILSKNYVRSSEGNYVLSILEYLQFQENLDQTVIVTFRIDALSNDLINNRKKNKPWTVLAVPNETDKLPVFWSTLKTVLYDFKC